MHCIDLVKVKLGLIPDFWCCRVLNWSAQRDTCVWFGRCMGSRAVVSEGPVALPHKLFPLPVQIPIGVTDEQEGTVGFLVLVLLHTLPSPSAGDLALQPPAHRAMTRWLAADTQSRSCTEDRASQELPTRVPPLDTPTSWWPRSSFLSDHHSLASTTVVCSPVPGINSLSHNRVALLPHKPWLTHSYANFLMGLQNFCKL